MTTHWTPELDELLKHLIDEKQSARQVAAQINRKFKLGITRQAAIGRAYRKGWKFHSDRELTHEHVYNRPSKQKSRAKALKRVAVPKVIVPDILEPLPQGPLSDFPLSGCKWIHGDPKEGPWRCCAAPVSEGASYCAHHNKRCNNGLTTHQARFAKPNFSVPGWAA